MGKRIEGILHMVGGAGDTSYASNSKFPEKVLHMAKPILEEAIGGVYMSLLPERMAVVDLGCSSGPNTLEVVSEVLDVIGKLRRSLGRQEMPEILFFLNDLPGMTSITSSGLWEITRGRSRRRRGICWCHTTSWEFQAPSTAGFSLVKVSTSSTLPAVSTGSLRFLKVNREFYSTIRTSMLQRQAHWKL
ncbi:unnamed protein product [Musa banksii]